MKYLLKRPQKRKKYSKKYKNKRTNSIFTLQEANLTFQQTKHLFNLFFASKTDFHQKSRIFVSNFANICIFTNNLMENIN